MLFQMLRDVIGILVLLSALVLVELLPALRSEYAYNGFGWYSAYTCLSNSAVDLPAAFSFSLIASSLL